MKLSNGILAIDLHAFSGDGLSGYFVEGLGALVGWKT